MLLELILILGTLAIDQYTKILTEANLALGESIPVLEGVFEFANVHNTGAAWGMLAGGRWFFIVVTLIACSMILYILIKFHKDLGIVARVCLALLFAGAIGNLIDRIFLGYVRDMLYFSLINFPVFNVADSAVCIAAGLMIIDTLFVKKGSLYDAIEPWFEIKGKKEIVNQESADCKYAESESDTNEQITE